MSPDSAQFRLRQAQLNHILDRLYFIHNSQPNMVEKINKGKWALNNMNLQLSSQYIEVFKYIMY